MITHVLELARQQAWALDRRVLASFETILLRRASGTRLAREEINEALAAAGQPPPRGVDDLSIEQGGIAVVPVRGVIGSRASLIDDVSPGRGSSVQKISGLLQKAAADQAVRAVLLDIDSPGGTVGGIPELAGEIRAFTDTTGKPVWAFAGGAMASAAYWLGAAAQRVLATPSATVGSIGVYTVLEDSHRLAEQEGVDVHVVSTGEHKGAGESGSRVTRAHLEGAQETVDATFAMFRRDLAADRQLADQALECVCTGQAWVAERAHELGLVDRVATRAQVLREFRAALDGKGGTNAVPGASRDPSPTAARAEAVPMAEPKIETVDALRAAYPQLVEQLVAAERTSASATQQTAVDAAVAQAIAGERTRAARILRNATGSQGTLAAELVASGADVAEALEKLLADPRRNAAALLDKEQKAAAPAIDGKASTEPAAPAGETDEQRCTRLAKEQWAKDPAVAREIYGSESNLAAFLLAQSRGVSCVGR